MTTLQQIELTCPVCLVTFLTQEVVSTNSFGGKRTDFHERAAGTQPLPYCVHTCAHCGYSALPKDFAQEVDFALKERVQRLLSRPEPTLTGSEKYERAAKVAEWRNADPKHIGDLWIRAAWCAVDEGDTEAERYYRRKAAWRYMQALEAPRYDGYVEQDQRAVLTYLVGELWRRIGDLAKANEWFDKVPGEVTDPATQKWVVDAAIQQRDYPREWFG